MGRGTILRHLDSDLFQLPLLLKYQPIKPRYENNGLKGSELALFSLNFFSTSPFFLSK